jgi:hypothetical protein
MSLCGTIRQEQELVSLKQFKPINANTIGVTGDTDQDRENLRRVIDLRKLKTRDATKMVQVESEWFTLPVKNIQDVSGREIDRKQIGNKNEVILVTLKEGEVHMAVYRFKRGVYVDPTACSNSKEDADRDGALNCAHIGDFGFSPAEAILMASTQDGIERLKEALKSQYIFWMYDGRYAIRHEDEQNPEWIKIHDGEVQPVTSLREGKVLLKIPQKKWNSEKKVGVPTFEVVIVWLASDGEHICWGLFKF